VATQRHVQVSYYGDKFAQLVDEYKDPALFAMGGIVSREAVRRAPTGRTGNLVKSAYIATRKRTNYVRRRYWRKEQMPPEDGVTVGFSAPHAHLIESGRHASGLIRPRAKRGKRAALKFNGQYRKRSSFRPVSAKPFLGPAIDATKDTMVNEAAKVLRNGLEGGMPKVRR